MFFQYAKPFHCETKPFRLKIWIPNLIDMFLTGGEVPPDPNTNYEYALDENGLAGAELELVPTTTQINVN